MQNVVPHSQCAVCREIKPETEFYLLRKNDPQGKRSPYCRECNKAKSQAWFANNKGMHGVYARKAKLKSKYGLTIEAHTAMLQTQFYRCAACGDKFDPESKLKDPVVDHDHETGENRELLCRECNIVFGHVKDDPVRLEKMIAYLRRHGK